MKKQTLLGAGMMLTAAIIWGIAFVFQDLIGSKMGAFAVNSLRFFVGGIALIPCILLFDLKSERRLWKRSGITKSELIGGIICGIVLSMASVFQQLGLSEESTGAGSAGFITSLYVVLVPIFSIFLGKRVGLKNWLCVALSLVGVALISYNGGFAKGDILVFVCAVIFALHILVIDRFTECDGVRMSCIQFWTAGIILLPLALIIDKPTISQIGECLLPLLYLGIFSSGVGYTLQILGQKRASATVSSIILSLESVFAAIFGVLITDEDMSLRKLLGCITVFASVVLTQISFGAGKSNEAKDTGLGSTP